MVKTDTVEDISQRNK